MVSFTGLSSQEARARTGNLLHPLGCWRQGTVTYRWAGLGKWDLPGLGTCPGFFYSGEGCAIARSEWQGRLCFALLDTVNNVEILIAPSNEYNISWADLC